MKVALISLGALLLVTGNSFAQQTPRIEIFGGYSLEHISTCGPSGSSDFFLCSVEEGTDRADNYHGWNASGTFFVYSFLGFTADLAGHYGTTTVPSSGATSSFSTSRYSYLFGPVAAVRNHKLAPFAHALFGGISNTFSCSGVSCQNYNAFALAVGAGIDLKASRHWAFRLGQFDYERTKEPYPISSTAPVNGFRLSTGIVFRP